MQPCGKSEPTPSPYFWECFTRTNAPLKIKLLTWVSSHRFLGFRYTNPSVFNEQAFMGFQALGPDAASAVPKLIKLLDQNFSEFRNLHHKDIGSHWPGSEGRCSFASAGSNEHQCIGSQRCLLGSRSDSCRAG